MNDVNTETDARTPKVWFITGATSGFGRLWAEAALQRGDRVVATARGADRLNDLVAGYGDTILALQLDVTDREAVFAAVAHAVQRMGRLDVVINNAGFGHWGMVEEVTERELREVMETNFFGTAWVTQAVLPVLRRQRSGHLIQVTSEGGVRAYPGVGAYHASKWAVEGLTESLAQETEVFGFHVTALEPGAYQTGFAGAIRASEERPEYRESRAASAVEFALGEPAATVPALFRLVDSDRPPRRLILGRAVPEMVSIYQDRIQIWRDWESVSAAAFGNPDDG